MEELFMTREAKNWWERIGSAKNFLEDTISMLLNDKSISIHYANNAGWIDEGREIIQNYVHDASGMRAFININADEIGEDIGRYMFKTFCSAKTQSMFSLKKGYINALASECTAISESYIWISGIENKEQELAYGQFISDYIRQTGKKQQAVFILESQYNGKRPPLKFLSQIDWEARITPYDLALFAAGIISEQKIDNQMSQYAAELSANLCQLNAELCAKLANNSKALIQAPLKTYSDIIGETQKKKMSEAEIEKCIWEVQIRVFFPIIEQKRLHLVRKYQREIEKHLPLMSACGDVINDASLVEIGVLKSMQNKKILRTTDIDAIHIEELWHARNALAHLKTIESLPNVFSLNIN